MNSRVLPAICALLFAVTGIGKVDASDEFSGLGLRVANGKAMLTDGSSQQGRNLSALTGAASIETATILSRREIHGVLFLVVHIEGPSLAHGGMSMCGAGMEGSLVWLKVFPGLLIADERAVLVDSCFLTLESYKQSSHGTFRATINSGSPGGGYTVRYDESAPARGFSVTPLR